MLAKARRRSPGSSALRRMLFAVLSACLDPSVPVAAAQPLPDVCRLGAYVMVLSDFNADARTFGCTAWMWSNCSSPRARGLNRLDFVRAKTVDMGEVTGEKIGEGKYEYAKMSGTFRYDWDLRNYPFDRHTLKIPIENSDQDATLLLYQPDNKGSGLYQSAQIPDGWRVHDFQIQDSLTRYDTVFGDPRIRKPGTEFSQLTLAVTIERTSYVSFFKLTAGVYLAFLVALLSLFMDASVPPLMSGRMAVMAGALFTALINLRSTDAVLGRVENLTLMDKIHIVTMIFILVIGIIATISNVAAKGREKQVERLNHIGAVVLLAAFVGINALLILGARASG